MQAIMEPIFDVAYLVSVITIGIKMIRRSGGKSRQYTLFGWSVAIVCKGSIFFLPSRLSYLRFLRFTAKILNSLTYQNPKASDSV